MFLRPDTTKDWKRFTKSPDLLPPIQCSEVQRKCLTKGTGSESLRRAIDEYWERFEKKGKERSIRG